jgi:hypothetical protein
MFGMIKSSKLWLSNNLTPQEKRWVEFKRKGRQSKEVFIPEQTMHRIISKIQGDFNDNVDFVYGIIADYDNTCINIRDIELNVEERIALHALKAESNNYIERVKKYNDVLKGKTHIGECYELYEKEIDKEIKSSKTKYDNEKCPEDLRQEQLEKERLEREKLRANGPKLISAWDIIDEVGNSLSDCMDNIYNIINNFDENINDVEDYELSDEQSSIIYDDIVCDVQQLDDNITYVKECIDEKTKRSNALLTVMDKIEKSENDETENLNPPSWLKDIIK